MPHVHDLFTLKKMHGKQRSRCGLCGLVNDSAAVACRCRHCRPLERLVSLSATGGESLPSSAISHDDKLPIIR